MHHIAAYIWVDIDSGTGVLPDGVDPMYEPMLPSYQ